MDEQLKKIGRNIADFWKNLGKKLKIIIIASLVIILITAIVLTVILNKTEYVVLFSKLDEAEVTEVLTKLQEKNITYKYESNGDILVPEKQETMLRMQLAQEGYPKSGYNYDIFTNNIDFMTTDYEKRTYYTLQIQERLQTTIKSIPGVKQAAVTIGKPDNNNYAWDANKEDITASVKLTLAPGIELTKSQVQGIVRLVQTSIVGLKEENISLLDTNGNDLVKNLGMQQTDTMKLKMEIESLLAEEREEKIKKILEKAYGEDSVEVSVNVVVNLDKVITENLVYTPNKDTNAGVISSKDRNVEAVGEGQVQGGVVGTENNSEIPVYPQVTIDGNNIYYKDYDSIKYLVSQLKEQIQHEPGSIEEISVGVILDKDKITTEERDNIINLISRSSGVTAENVALHNLKFYKPSEGVWSGNEDGDNVFNLTPKTLLLLAIIAFAILLLIIIIIIILVKKAKKRKRLEEEAALAEAQAAAEREGWENIQDEIEVKETKEMVLKKQIRDFVSANPEIAAQLVRTWIKGEDD